MFKNNLINNTQKIFDFIENDRSNNDILRIKDDNIYNFINKIYYDNYRERYYDVNEIINNHYETIIFNCYDYSINIQINNNFVSIYVNDNKIITFNNCNIKKIILIDCNLMNDNKLNLDIKNCDDLIKIEFNLLCNTSRKKIIKDINFKNLKINISNCKSFNLFSFKHFKNEDNDNLNQILDIIYNSNLYLNELYFYFDDNDYFYDCELNINIKYCNYIKNIILKHCKINLDKFINLEKLIIDWCGKIKEIPNNLINLNYLYLKECNNHYNIKEIPDNLINLKYLEIKDCRNIKGIPNTLINLKKLKIEFCDNIKKIFNNLINLKYLEIKNCKNIKEIPKTLINLRNLKIDEYIYGYINNLPKTLIKLKKLYLDNCFNINYLSDTYINLKKLKLKLNIHKKDNNIFKINNNFINLSKLNIYYYNCNFNDFSGDIYNTFSLKINIKNKDKINNYINKTKKNLLYGINDIYNKHKHQDIIYNSKKENFYYKINDKKKYFNIFL